MTVLVIGYGNELRCDDGAGPRVAAAAEEWGMPGVETVTCHQLTPELSEQVSKAKAVIFVDATVSDSDATVTVERIEAGTGHVEILGHTSRPEWILSLSHSVFGRCPPAWVVTIPGETFEVGEGLSERAESGVRTAIERIRGLCETLLNGD